MRKLTLISILFLFSQYCFAAPVVKNFTGFEVGGIEEFATVGNSPSVQSTTVRTGTYALQLSGSATANLANIPTNFDTAGFSFDTSNYMVAGFAFRASDTTPTLETEFFRYSNSGGNIHVSLHLETDGDLILKDVGGTIRITVTAPFSVDTWYYIELATFNDNSGNAELFINSSSVGSASAFDSGGDNTYRLRFVGPGALDGNYFIDDVYHYSDTVSLPTRLSNTATTPYVEVFAYQSGNTGTAADTGLTTNNSTLASGSWNGAGKTPIATGNTAVYTATPVDGAVKFDDTASGGRGPGPSGGAYTVDGTLKAGRWWIYGLRGSGGGTTHTLYYGNGTDVPLTGVAKTFSTSNVFHAILSESSTIVPTSSEVFAEGFGVSGAQDLTIAEMGAELLHLKIAAGATSLKTVNGLAEASVKNKNGLANASIKSWNGLQ